MQKEWAIKEDFIFKCPNLMIRKPKVLLIILPVPLINKQQKKSPGANLYNVIYFFFCHSVLFTNLSPLAAGSVSLAFLGPTLWV